MAAKRCPMCHRASTRSAWRCSCGYEFGQDIDKVLVLLRDQRRTARIGLAVLGSLTAAMAVGASVALYYFDAVFGPAIVFGALCVLTARVAHKLLITRASLRQLEKRELPRAQLLKS